MKTKHAVLDETIYPKKRRKPKISIYDNDECLTEAESTVIQFPMSMEQNERMITATDNKGQIKVTKSLKKEEINPQPQKQRSNKTHK